LLHYVRGQSRDMQEHGGLQIPGVSFCKADCRHQKQDRGLGYDQKVKGRLTDLGGGLAGGAEQLLLSVRQGPGGACVRQCPHHPRQRLLRGCTP